MIELYVLGVALTIIVFNWAKDMETWNDTAEMVIGALAWPVFWPWFILYIIKSIRSNLQAMKKARKVENSTERNENE
jgi:hypothetical protein